MTTTLTPPVTQHVNDVEVRGGARHASPPDLPGRPSWPARAIRGRPDDPAWVRPTLLGLLTATAVLYLWDLGASGWANSFYSAAVQAGSVSWKAFFFGSSDAANSITVDKPPASLWVMALSVRIFGLSSWSILVPQALMGVASVGVLYAAVRRRFSPAAGLLAGATLALTPVATLMFRFNNPDALLVLVMTIGGYAVLRAVESGRTRWLVFAGALIGFGFLTKQLQTFLVVPAFAVTYLVAAPKALGRRVLDLLAAGAAMVVAFGWWIAIVMLVPAADRPYIGGSQTNSILELTFGYNGLGRLTGNETGSVGGGGGNSGGNWGATGITRLFTSEIGGQISWLIPAALILLAAGLWFRRQAPRTDPIRAALILWGGWLLVTGLTFSFMAGIFHAYYTVALAPAVAAVVGIGVVLLWRHRNDLVASTLLGAVTAVTAIWSYILLSRSSDFLPWLRLLILVVGLAAAAGLMLQRSLGNRLLKAVAVAAVLSGLAGPAAYAVETAGTAHSGSIVTAGPTVSGGMGGMGGGRGGMGGQRPTGTGFGGGTTTGGTSTGTTGGTSTGTTTTTGGTSTGTTTTGGTGQAGGGGIGGLLQGSTPSTALVSALEKDASSYTWVAATVGSNNASGYQLATQDPVMAIGGFNGSDPSPTLAQFEAYVKAGKIHYFIPGGTGSGSNTVAAQITTWVEANYTSTSIGGTTVYDLSSSSSSTS